MTVNELHSLWNQYLQWTTISGQDTIIIAVIKFLSFFGGIPLAMFLLVASPYIIENACIIIYKLLKSVVIAIAGFIYSLTTFKSRRKELKEERLNKLLKSVEDSGKIIEEINNIIPIEIESKKEIQ